jgi:hypothetical protein
MIFVAKYIRFLRNIKNHQSLDKMQLQCPFITYKCPPELIFSTTSPKTTAIEVSPLYNFLEPRILGHVC